VTFPESFASSRLLARRLQPEDASEIHRMHQDPEQMALLGGVRDEQQTAAYMARNLAHWSRYGFGPWLLIFREDDRVAGRALLRHLTLETGDEVEVGYSLHPVFWGRGLATEIAGACLEWARTDLRLASVVALTRPDNIRSQRVLTKIGMQIERQIVHEGEPHLVFRIRFDGPAVDA